MSVKGRQGFGAGRRIRLEGRTIGFWEVQCLAPDAKALSYVCRCVCGKSRIVLENSLLRNYSRSCGCMSQQLRNEKKLNERLTKPSKFPEIKKYE